ncbi:MAG TPA: DUF3509 domain-containing protein [Pseudomonas sp.]|jgi:hypothetical protein|nr:DUF3509 domain-containing protein [Pseudomonas sp.]
MKDTHTLLTALAAYNVTLGPRRPDGGRVITLHDENGEPLIQRVVSKALLGHPEGLAELLDSVRRDLLVTGGCTDESVLAALRGTNRVRTYA